MAYFDGIKPGDSVYHVGLGLCEVFSLKDDGFYIDAKIFPNGSCGTFVNFEGEVSLPHGHGFFPLQSVFWTDPHIIPPPKPLYALPYGDIVSVWNNDNDNQKFIRVSAGTLNPNGFLEVIEYNTDGVYFYSFWKNWEIYLKRGGN